MSDKFNEQFLAALLDLTKGVGEFKTAVTSEFSEIRKELSEVHHEFREEIKVINATIAEEQKTTGVIKAALKVWESKKSFIIGAGAILVLTGASLGGLIVDRVNDTTGVTTLKETVKKNSETLKHLCAYLKAECE